MSSTQDSNSSQLAIAEESSPGVLAASTKFYIQEPNSYNDVGSDIKRTTRRPISADRQRLKGSNTDRDVAAGFNVDFTQTNAARQIQGFLFTTAIEKPSTKPFNGAQTPVTAVNGSGVYTTASASSKFKVGDLVFTSGFTQYVNNGIGAVTAVTSTTVTITMDNASGSFVESSPPAAAKIEVVGVQYLAGALVLGGGAGTISTITRNNATDPRGFDTLGLTVGEWICVGGDQSATKFAATKVGLTRLVSITSTVLTFDKIEWVPNNDSGTGSTIRLFFGRFMKNGTTKHTYQIERTLGSDDDGVQGEYIVGAMPNEMTLHVPQSDKANLDLSYIGLDHVHVTGAQGLRSAQNGCTTVASPGEAAFNTSSDLANSEISVISAATPYDTPIVGYINSVDLTIKNNVTANKALGVFGAFNHTAGLFEVDVTVSAYFDTVGLLDYGIDNDDISMHFCLAHNNAGVVFDLPLCSLNGDKVTVSMDTPIMLPLSVETARNAQGYTVSFTQFPYLPNLAMPS